jgi:hypothetical protein
MYSIDNIPITAETIANTYRKYYPTQFASTSKYNFVNLFGIRVSTADTSQLDDFLGAIKLSSGYSTMDTYEMVVCRASLEPAPMWISKPFDAEASLKKVSIFILIEAQEIQNLLGLTEVEIALFVLQHQRRYIVGSQQLLK